MKIKMNCIDIIDDHNFNLQSNFKKQMRTRIAARGIVIRKDGKIALFNKVKKNEYKLPGGGVENKEKIQETLKREVLEETGCEIKIIEELGMIEEHRYSDNFKQVSYVYVAEVIKESKKLKLTSKEQSEGGQVIWVTPEEGLKLISECFDKLKPSKYENLYHSRFIVLRDKKILEYYLNNKTTNRWNNLYKQHIENDFKNWTTYFKVKMRLKKSFLKQVIKYSKSGKPILECGCGTGKSSVYFATLNLETYAMDLEPAMVKEAKKLSKTVYPQNKVKVIQGDIRDIPFKNKFFSVTHSSGVLEHYQDEEIIKIINEQIRVSDYCIFSVPTQYFEKKMLGNERFLTRKKWREIIAKSNAKIIKEGGYHYKTLDKRIIDIIKKPKRLFKPIALYTFVLK